MNKKPTGLINAVSAETPTERKAGVLILCHLARILAEVKWMNARRARQGGKPSSRARKQWFNKHFDDVMREIRGVEYLWNGPLNLLSPGDREKATQYLLSQIRLATSPEARRRKKNGGLLFASSTPPPEDQTGRPPSLTKQEEARFEGRVLGMQCRLFAEKRMLNRADLKKRFGSYDLQVIRWEVSDSAAIEALEKEDCEKAGRAFDRSVLPRLKTRYSRIRHPPNQIKKLW
ncbi:MAG: hypothetical protein M0P95_07200 [Sulfuritalea sp.]|jgi:hypothetical protein|nr:hypothetical protein [Sulfuritalea sp.]